HFCPTRVRNWMPSNHSSSVRFTSRAKACRCLIRLAMSVCRRGSDDVLVKRRTTSSVMFCSFRLRMVAFLYNVVCPTCCTSQTQSGAWAPSHRVGLPAYQVRLCQYRRVHAASGPAASQHQGNLLADPAPPLRVHTG